MKKILLLALIATTIGHAQKRKLVWEENFKGSKLNESAWNYEMGDGCPNICGWGNNEREHYTKTNHMIKNGDLTIQARKEADGTYTSTRITTKGKKEFQYGRVECRAKLPTGQGIWPAFWMLGSNIPKVGWPKCGEIDILEYIGKNPQMIYTTLHTQDGHGDNGHSKKTEIANVEEGFHLFAVDWTKDKMDFFVDDQLVFTYNPANKNEDNWPFNQPFYIIVNMAVGGNFGGPEVNDAIFPQQFVIDYIKVYQ